MKIAIDARWIFPEISGIGAYTRELIRHLALVDPENTYILLFDHPGVRDRTLRETGVGSASNVLVEMVPYGVFSWRSQALLPRLLSARGVDVYHSTNYMVPLRLLPAAARAPKMVVTIHDVIPLLFPDHAPRSKKARLFLLYRWIMRRIAAIADTIVTDSRASAADVVKHLRIPGARAGRVKAIYCGVSPRFHPPEARRAKGGVEIRELLYVGRSDPYKNLGTLVRAFAQARRECPFPLHLTLSGSPDARYPEAPVLTRELGLEREVTWTGYVSDDALLALYQRADVMVHPSRYEGFGLQVAEAMACGVPVICSNAGSLPEVVGDAAITLPPDDVGSGLNVVPRLADRHARRRARAGNSVRGFPARPIYTLIHNRRFAFPPRSTPTRSTSWLQHLPGIFDGLPPPTCPLFPAAIAPASRRRRRTC
jgi:glycosyltransferase involved in cell wall biosynthesis